MGFSSGSTQSNSNSSGSSAAYNQAYPAISQDYTGTIGETDKASNAIASLLGLNGTSSQNSGFQNFMNSGAYNFVQQQGEQGINSNDASKGLLDSGSALKSLDTYNTGLSQQYLNSYLSSLTGLANTGISAGGLVTQAGNTSNSQNSSTGASSGSNSSLNLGS